jgi:class 3 adenylate cyclase
MDCPRCHRENSSEARFCGECGSSVIPDVTCSSCGQSNPGGQKFCNACGSRLGKLPAPAERDPRDYTPKHIAEKIHRSKSALEGERKQVTVLFVDVKGSMGLAEQLDPEDWHAIMNRFLQLLADGVHRFEGTVNQYTGDGIMALFGAPIAHEDHAQRACYAALHLRDALRIYSDELRLARGLDFAVRIGLNTGEVVVGTIGDDLRMDYTALGHTVGLAQRMEQIAAAQSICISEATARLVAGYVDLRDLGTTAVKGSSAPIHVFEVVGLGRHRTRLDVARGRGLTRFVGRDEDMRTLEAALEQACLGNGQVVGVVAEAGTGKSRLCFEFVERCRRRGISVNEGHCPAHGKTVPYLPALELLRGIFGIMERDSDHEARRKLAGELVLLDERFHGILPLLFEFLGIPDPERPAPQLNPEARQRQLAAFVRHLVQARSVREPRVVLIDDAHWIDAGSDGFLAHAVEALTGTRTLLLVNFRPEYHAEWMSRSYYRQLPLLPLGSEATEELLADLLGRDGSLSGLAVKIQERTRGNPFFIEEVALSLVESGRLEGTKGAYRLVAPARELEIPGSVQAVLAARIDRLPQREKRLLQTASVIGKEVPEPLLERVTGLPDAERAASLAALVQAEFLLEKALYPEAEYAFKHPLTQEVAYASQLAAQRAPSHASVARAIEALRPDRLDEQAALLAYHWERAGDALAAARWHRRAAEWLFKNEPAESYAHSKRVYELAKAVSVTPESRTLLIEACCRLVAHSFVVGLSEDERDRLAAEGRELADGMRDRRALFTIETGLATSRMLSGWSREGPLAPIERAIAIAGDLDPKTRIEAGFRLSNILAHMGRADALRAIDEVLELLGQEPSGDFVGIDAFSILNFALFHKAFLLMWAGRPGEAVGFFERSLQAARERDEMTVIHMQCWGGAAFEELTGTPRQALARSREAVERAERSGAIFNETVALLYLGWAQLLHGQVGDALASLQRVDQLQRERGIASVKLNLGQALLAEAHLAAGDAAQARSVANRCTAERGTWVFELRAHLARSRVLRSLDGTQARTDIEASLARAEILLEKSGARAFAPFIVEERARLCAVLGDVSGAARHLREAQRLFAELGATGHAERVAKEI